MWCQWPIGHLQTGAIHQPRLPVSGYVQIQVTHKHVGCDCDTTFTAHAGNHTFQSEPPPPKNPRTMMAKFVNETATSAETPGQGRGRRRWRNSSTRKFCESNRTNGLVSGTVRKEPAPGPLWEHKRALSLREPAAIAARETAVLRGTRITVLRRWANTINQCWPTGHLNTTHIKNGAGNISQ